TWSMLLRQEGALDRSIDRKVRILMGLRKESTNLRTAPAGQDDGARMESMGSMGSMEEALDSDIMSHISQSLEAVEDLKMNERRGNIIENKGSEFERPGRNGN